VLFDENSSRINFMNASPGLLQDGPFGNVDDTGSPIPISKFEPDSQTLLLF
jgi:hypothetical protein